jgi:hypothetical protein
MSHIAGQAAEIVRMVHKTDSCTGEPPDDDGEVKAEVPRALLEKTFFGAVARYQKTCPVAR